MDQLVAIANAIGDDLETALEELAKKVYPQIYPAYVINLPTFNRSKLTSPFFGKVHETNPDRSRHGKRSLIVFPQFYNKLDIG